MAVWVDCNGSGNYFGGFACDMGPYVGPWPLLPPGEMGGLDPAARDELDFYVMLPNPADPTDVTIAGDGSYDTPLWDAYRYFTNSTPPMGFGYFGDSIGPGGFSPIPSTPPVGAHLYVVSYAAVGEPPNPPQFYVPPTYAAGGAAAFETAMGHWSDEQAPFTQTQSVFPLHSGDAYYGGSVDGIEYDGDHDVPSAATAQIADILASTPVSGGITPDLTAQKDSLPAKTFVAMRANVGWDPYDGTAALNADHPPALNALTYLVDYANPPFVEADGSLGKEYRYDSTPGFSWEAGLVDGFHDETYDGAATGVTLPIPLPYRFLWIPGTTISGRPWTISGNSLGDVTGTPHAVGTGPTYMFALDYSPVNVIAFVVFAAPVSLFDGFVAGLTDFPMPGIGSESYEDSPTVGRSTPNIVIDRTAWQYWVPGAIVPTLAWHTIAGSWASISGAPMAIFTPGLGPVDYADGPA